MRKSHHIFSVLIIFGLLQNCLPNADSKTEFDLNQYIYFETFMIQALHFPNTSQRGLFNLINPLTIGGPPALA